MTSKTWSPGAADFLRFSVDIVVLAVAITALVMAMDFGPLTRPFALVVTSGAVMLAMAQLSLDVRKAITEGGRLVQDDVVPTASLATATDAAGQLEAGKRTARYLSWLVSPLIFVWILGMGAGSAIFVGAFLRLEARLSHLISWLSSLAVFIAMVLLDRLLPIYWPASLFGDLLRF